MKILGILGSLRRDSYNGRVFRTLSARFPSGVDFVPSPSIGDLPLYDADLIHDGLPSSVIRFRDAIAGADGLVWVTPEYNHSIPGTVKNAVDWLPHPLPKASAVLVVTPGRGGLRCRTELTRILTEMGGVVAPGYPEPCIQYADDVMVETADGGVRFLNPGIDAMLDGMCGSLMDIVDTGIATLTGNLFTKTLHSYHARHVGPRWDDAPEDIGLATVGEGP